MAEPRERGELTSLVDAFLTHSRLERGLSKHTLEAYSRDLVRFGAYLEELGIVRCGAVPRVRDGLAAGGAV